MGKKEGNNSITSSSCSSFQLCVGPPCVMGYQRQPEGMYFSYLSDFYFGGLRGVQWRIPCLTRGSISPLIVLDGVLPFPWPPTRSSCLRPLATTLQYWGRQKKKNSSGLKLGSSQLKKLTLTCLQITFVLCTNRQLWRLSTHVLCPMPHTCI